MRAEENYYSCICSLRMGSSFCDRQSWISKLLCDAAFTWVLLTKNCYHQNLGESLCIFTFSSSFPRLLNGFDFGLFWMARHWKPAIFDGVTVLLKKVLPGKVAIPSFQSKAPNGSSPSSAVFFSVVIFFTSLLLSMVTGCFITALLSSTGFVDEAVLSSAAQEVIIGGGEELLTAGKGSDLITKFSMGK